MYAWNGLVTTNSSQIIRQISLGAAGLQKSFDTTLIAFPVQRHEIPQMIAAVVEM